MADNNSIDKVIIMFLVCVILLGLFALMAYDNKEKKDRRVYIRNKNDNEVYQNISGFDKEEERKKINNKIYNNIIVSDKETMMK